MHSWYDLYHFGRQRTEELRRSIEETRWPRGRASRRDAVAHGTLTLTRAGLKGGRAAIILARGEILSLRVRGPLKVSCMAGQLWATLRGSQDVLLEPWSGVSIAAKGLLVIEALRTATVALECLPPSHLRIGLARRQPLGNAGAPDRASSPGSVGAPGRVSSPLLPA